MEETSLLAYYLWEQAHCPPGEDLKFWLQAEEQLFGKRSPQAAAKAKTTDAARRVPAPAGNGAARSQPKPARPKAAKPQARAR